MSISVKTHNHELMTQQDIFGDQRLTVAHGRMDKAEEQKQVLEHRPNIMPVSAESSGPTFAPRQDVLDWSPE